MKIAITGTIGSGKSEVSLYLQDKGYYVFDCDKANAYLLQEGNLGYILVKEAFSDCFDDNVLNKEKLAKRVFNNKEDKKTLENIMHPLILEMMNSYEDVDPFFAEVPLLFEANWQDYFDRSLLIIADNEDIVKRLIEKGYDEASISERINNQMPIKDKMKLASQIIYNNGSLDDLHNLIDDWLKSIC